MQKKRYKSDEIFPMLRAIEQGQMTREEFCGITGLKQSSYIYWRGKYLEHKRSQSAFVAIDAIKSSGVQYAMEIHLISGNQIRFTSVVPADYLQMLLKIQ